MSGPKFLEGDHVALHVPTENDVAFLLENENNPAVRRTRSASSPTGSEQVRRRLGGTTGRTDDTLALVVCADGDSVGFVYLIREKPNDDTYGRAELAYWVAPDEQGNGYATDAARTVVAHGFDRLRLHKVIAKAFSHNDASKRVLEKIGFVQEGTFRDEAFVDGEYRDIVRYGLLADA